MMNKQELDNELSSVRDKLMPSALYYTANRADAEDLVQKTTLTILENIEKYVENRNFVGWAARIMQRLFINDYHKTLRNQTYIDNTVELYDIHTSAQAGIGDPEEMIRLKEIKRLISELEPIFRIPFEMVLQGYQYQDIADKMGIPLNTVKTRIHKARKLLQKQLEE